MYSWRQPSSSIIVTVDTPGHFEDAVAQNKILLHSKLIDDEERVKFADDEWFPLQNLKRKRDEDEDGEEIKENDTSTCRQICYGIVSDARYWQLVEASWSHPALPLLYRPDFRTIWLPIPLRLGGK
ncbi:hypothetical protein BGX28_001264 [Mortierella sp. GBA30]|nr:hypothetical protein BGX28_001264 [Mortierella sp. GBA30]